MEVSGKLLKNPGFQAGVLFVLFIGAYFVPLSSLYDTWMTDGDYSYGILVPFISAYLLWDKRHAVKNSVIRPCWPSFPLLIIFVIISVYGILGSSGSVSRPAVPVLAVLFIVFCFGTDLFKKISLPLCFLIFMVPLPTVLNTTIGVYLKTISSEFGGRFLQALGYSVYVSGNIIDLGVTKLQVVDACSGLRFLFPLLALGVIYGYFFETVLWKRAACVIITVPIAIFTNIVRIAVTGILTYRFGPEMAEGFFHSFEGFAVFALAFAMLFVFGRILRLFPSSGRRAVKQDGPPDTGSNISAFALSVILLLGVGFLTLNTKAMPQVILRGGIQGFPLDFGQWHGRQNTVKPEIIRASGADDAFDGVYVNSSNQAVSLYMGYRGTAFLETTNFFHSPSVCLPSAGWRLIGKSGRVIHDVAIFGDLPVTEMIMESMGTKYLVYFWFQTATTVTGNKDINRLHLALHAIRKDNTYDMFIRTITAEGSSESIEKMRTRMDVFVREMMKTLAVFLAEHLN